MWLLDRQNDAVLVPGEVTVRLSALRKWDYVRTERQHDSILRDSYEKVVSLRRAHLDVSTGNHQPMRRQFSYQSNWLCSMTEKAKQNIFRRRDAAISQRELRIFKQAL